MGKVTVIDGATIPQKILDQAAADDATQAAEIKEHGPVIVPVPAEGAPEVPAAVVPPVPVPIAPPEPVPFAAPAPVPVAPGAPGSVEFLQHQLATEQQRYRTLQGQMDSQGPQMAAEIKSLRAEIAASRQPAAPTVAPAMSLLKPEEREVYGGSELPAEVRMAGGMIDAATGTLNQKSAAMEQRIDEMEQQAIESQRQARIAAVMNSVEPLFPGASRLNHDQQFNAWLNNADPRSGTGSTYSDRGSDAFARGDIYAIADLMHEYQAAGGLVVAPAVAAQIRPAQTMAAGTITPLEPVMVTESEIVRFNEDRVRNRCMKNGVLMTDDEIANTAQIIDQAIAEGRVTAGV